MKSLIISIFILVLSSCAPLATIPSRVKIDIGSPELVALLGPQKSTRVESTKITLGSVQSRIKIGTSSAEVIDALGSPNIVTSNQDNSETWVYDKIMTENESANGLLNSVSTTTNKTLIVTIRFDKTNKVTDVKYRQTSY